MSRHRISSNIKCDICGQNYAPHVIRRHQVACQCNFDDQESARQYLTQQKLSREGNGIEDAPDTVVDANFNEFTTFDLHENLQTVFYDFHEHQQPLEQYDHNPIETTEGEPQADDIKIEYHPSSGKQAEILRFHEYGERKERDTVSVPPDSSPWKPWRSRVDFEVAKLALESSMSEDQINQLIDILKRVAQGSDNFTLKNNKEMQAMWDLAAERSIKFQNTEIPVSFRDQEPERFELHYRPAWDWLQELLHDAALASQMEWNAQRMYRYDRATNSWKRFIEEAWSANAWWKIQDNIPAGAFPLCIVFYADKNKLSSFGTAKGYPVILRCANLPMDIRNGTGHGGGRVVGWLPIVAEDASRSGKSDFATFKCITGYTVDCGDGVRRCVYPVVLISSADFEEQTVVCLTRGTQGLCPCVKCEIPKDQLTDFDSEYTRRTAKHTVDIVNQALLIARTSKGESDTILKKHSLRPHINSFVRINNTDPHENVSFDDLHFLDSGLWEDHIFEMHKLHIKNVGRNAAVTIDNRYKTFPRWSKLHHFEDGISKITFNDGSKNRDISKIFLFAAHDAIPKEADKAGYTLLKVTRHYIDLVMYAGLEIQTSATITAGRASIVAFANALKLYRSQTTDLDKNWNLIKLHYLRHCWDDIESKGVLRGMSTKPNEKFHGPLRKTSGKTL
ncbi:hypothetical protein FB446DRAFT_787121 [Lentinula raphanica]|nr:hypothetical protein FB446DRAFT_787121 [Lentinula raphanica]